jgi:hypothetical protein
MNEKFKKQFTELNDYHSYKETLSVCRNEVETLKESLNSKQLKIEELLEKVRGFEMILFSQ